MRKNNINNEFVVFEGYIQFIEVQVMQYFSYNYILFIILFIDYNNYYLKKYTVISSNN